MVEKQVGTILELDHCYTCLLQKFLSLLLKVFQFGNKPILSFLRNISYPTKCEAAIFDKFRI